MYNRRQPAASSSRTQESTEPPAPTEVERRLRLVGSSDAENQRRRVQWTEETVDNEHMNLKKSKICCIFHPNKEFGESSEESEDYSSSSSSSSDSDSDANSDSSNSCGHSHRHSHRHRVRPNAYERKPKLKR